jgi:hypothetical protein
MNMLGNSSSVHFTHIACCWTFLPFALHTSPGTDRTENVSSIIACSLVAGVTTCPQSCSLAALVVLSLFTQLLIGNGYTCTCHNISIAQPQYLSRYTDYTTGWTTEEIEFHPRQRQDIFHFSITSRPSLGPGSLLFNGYRQVISLGQSGRGMKLTTPT